MNPEFRILHRFRFPVNLSYAFESLVDAGIFCKKSEEQNELWVPWEDYERASGLLNEMNLDDEPLSPDSEGYIEGYEEWINKQYLPGYFTGTTRPIWFKDKVYWKYFGPGFFGLGLFIFYIIATQAIEGSFHISALVMGILGAAYIAIGFYMVKATWGKGKENKPTRS